MRYFVSSFNIYKEWKYELFKNTSWNVFILRWALEHNGEAAGTDEMRAMQRGGNSTIDRILYETGSDWWDYAKNLRNKNNCLATKYMATRRQPMLKVPSSVWWPRDLPVRNRCKHWPTVQYVISHNWGETWDYLLYQIRTTATKENSLLFPGKRGEGTANALSIAEIFPTPILGTERLGIFPYMSFAQESMRIFLTML